MHDDHLHHEGLAHDLEALRAGLRRRQILRGLLGVGSLSLLGCVSEVSEAMCLLTARESAGPFPGDGSNGPNVLSQIGVVRSDIRASFGGAMGTAEGVPLRIELTLIDARNGCMPLANRAVYLWQSDREGRYSMYSDGVTEQNYLRGVQASDADGKVTFTSIFPACYDGRWPHLHFEVYPSLEAAARAESRIATSQLAFPEAACREVYREPGYEASANFLAGMTLAGDVVFRDGVETQLATVTGNARAGFVASLPVVIELGS